MWRESRAAGGGWRSGCKGSSSPRCGSYHSRTQSDAIYEWNEAHAALADATPAGRHDPKRCVYCCAGEEHPRPVASPRDALRKASSYLYSARATTNDADRRYELICAAHAEVDRAYALLDTTAPA